MRSNNLLGKLNIQGRLTFVRSLTHKLYFYKLVFPFDCCISVKVTMTTRGNNLCEMNAHENDLVENNPQIGKIAHIVNRPFAEIEEEKNLKQIEKAASHYLKTHPDFATHFTLSTSSRDVVWNANGNLRIGFVQDRWTTTLTSYWYCGDGEMGATRRGVRNEIYRITQTLQKLSYRQPTTTYRARERNHFFWALVDLVLLGDTENLSNHYDDVRSPTFLALDFEEASWACDIKKMLDRLKMFDFAQLERRLLELLNLPGLLENLKDAEKEARKLPPKSSDEILFATLLKYQRLGLEKPEKDTLSKKLESMFLRVPCRPLVDIFNTTLPFDFLIEYGDHNLWRAEAEKVFAPELRKLTDLITPLISNVFGYLWDEISAEEMELSKVKKATEYNLAAARYYSSARKSVQTTWFNYNYNPIVEVQTIGTTIFDREFLQLIQSSNSETAQQRQKREKREQHKSNDQQQKQQQRQKWHHRPRQQPQRQNSSRKYDHSRANVGKRGGR